MRNVKTRGEVAWYIPGRKTPIAYSVRAVSDLIAVLALEHPDETISQIRSRIKYDQGARAVLQAYICQGYGDQVASEWFKF